MVVDVVFSVFSFFFGSVAGFVEMLVRKTFKA